MSVSKIKLLHANPFYETYLRQFYKKTPYLETETYKKQYETIMSDSFGTADFWKINLEKTNNFEVIEIISNWPIIQKKWAEEHGIQYSEKNWAFDILEAQIEYHQPDVLFIRDFNTLHGKRILQIKQRFPFIKKIIGWDGIARNNPELFVGYDIMLSSLKSVTDFYQQRGFETYFFKHGFEKSLLDKIKPSPRNISCSFIGSVGTGKGKHKNRLHLLSYISQNTPIEIHAVSLPSWWDIIKRNAISILKSNYDNFLTLRDTWEMLNIKKINNKAVFGLEMYQLLADSKITINMHIENAGNLAGNMRMFEATGMGTCLLTDEKKNNSDYFEVGKEILTYTSKEDCLEKIKYLLRNPEEREKISKAGQLKTLKTYTLERSISDFSKYLENVLA